jgi:P-type Cu2+ transporter
VTDGRPAKDREGHDHEDHDRENHDREDHDHEDHGREDHGREDHGREDHDHEGHDQHAGHGVAMFRNRFWLSLALTLPVVFWSDHIQDLLGYTAPVFPGSEWIPAANGWQGCR